MIKKQVIICKKEIMWKLNQAEEFNNNTTTTKNNKLTETRTRKENLYIKYFGKKIILSSKQTVLKYNKKKK